MSCSHAPRQVEVQWVSWTGTEPIPELPMAGETGKGTRLSADRAASLFPKRKVNNFMTFQAHFVFGLDFACPDPCGEILSPFTT